MGIVVTVCGGQVVWDAAGESGHFDEPRSPEDMAAFDPESAAAAGTKDLQLGYTCVRNH
jgi:hypothetical protein